eukprot:Hpha_TRINITY_DN16399_c1_g3::TRINITY_DN16399_c1_g3_i2::g.58811::m.58811
MTVKHEIVEFGETPRETPGKPCEPLDLEQKGGPTDSQQDNPSPATSAWLDESELEAARQKKKNRRVMYWTVGIILIILILSGVVFLVKDKIIGALTGIQVNRNNPWHYIAFWAAGTTVGSVCMVLPFALYATITAFYLGLPSFAVIYAALVCGLCINFTAGRYARTRYATEDTWFPKAADYVRAIRWAFEKKPIELSFWIMFAPIPTALTHYMCARLTAVPMWCYMCGSLPQKFVYNAPFIFFAAQSDDLADAFRSGSPEKLAGTLAGLVGTVVFLIVLTWRAKKELQRYRIEQEVSSAGGRHKSALRLLPARVVHVSRAPSFS